MTDSNNSPSSSPIDPKKKRRSLRTAERWIKSGAIAAVVLGVVIMVLSFSLAGTLDINNDTLAKSGQLGDSFAPLTSLLTVAALLFTVLSVQIQRQELRLQRKEMRKQWEALLQQAAAQQEQVLAQLRMERAYLILASTMQLAESSEENRYSLKMLADLVNRDRVDADEAKEVVNQIYAGRDEVMKKVNQLGADTEVALKAAQAAIAKAEQRSAVEASKAQSPTQ